MSWYRKLNEKAAVSMANVYFPKLIKRSFAEVILYLDLGLERKSPTYLGRVRYVRCIGLQICKDRGSMLSASDQCPLKYVHRKYNRFERWPTIFESSQTILKKKSSRYIQINSNLNTTNLNPIWVLWEIRIFRSKIEEWTKKF